MRKALLLFLIPILSACLPKAKGNASCGRATGSQRYNYCVLPAERPGAPILYYLHGKGGDHRSWFQEDGYTRQIEEEWEKLGYARPNVIAVSYGDLWLLTPELREAFVKEAMPFLEGKIKLTPGRRILIGESMGGFNGVQLIMHHPKLFERAAILCPGILLLSPEAGEDEIAVFAEKNDADPEWILKAAKIFLSYFPRKSEWKQVLPLVAGKKLLGPKTPTLYISCGDKDEYGFFPGAKAFVDLARSKGVAVRWEAVKGGHCTVKADSVAAFFSR